MTDDTAATDDAATDDTATLDTATHDTALDGAGRRPHLDWRLAAVAVVVAVSAVLLARLLAPIRWVFDDWMFITTRHDLTVDNVLRSHNGHPVMLPALVYMLGFHAAGLHDLWYYKMALIIAHMALCGALARRVWQRHGAAPAAAVWFLVCFMGAGASNIVWPFQISLVGSVLFFLLAVDALDRLRQHGRRRDQVWVAAMLTCSLMCSAVGIAALVAVAAVVIVGRDRRRDWWVPVGPALLFAAWWAVYHDQTKGTTDVHALSRALWQSVQAAGAAILFGKPNLGGLFVVALFVGAIVALALRRIELRQTVGLLFVGTFWVMTTSTRALQLLMLGLKSPARYQYVAVVGLLLALCDMAPSARAASRSVARTALVGMVCLGIAASSVWAGHRSLFIERDLLVAFGQRTAAQLTVVDAHPDALSGDEALVTLVGVDLLTVRGYREASLALDSTAGFTSDELRALPDGRAGSAEVLMLPLLQVYGLPPEGCGDDGDATSTITLDPGATVEVSATEVTTLVASRWMPPNPKGTGVHQLAPGSWTITAPDDDLHPGWTLTFDRPVQPVSCG